MQTVQKLRPITRMPSCFPSKGIIRGDIGEFIILAHADRPPQYSRDGKTWKEIDLKVPEENALAAAFERRRWDR